jgi:hypothetical protein
MGVDIAAGSLLHFRRRRGKRRQQRLDASAEQKGSEGFRADHVAHIVVGVGPIVVRPAHVWGSAPRHAAISTETLTEIALRLALNSVSFRGARFAFGPRDPSQESDVIAGYNININKVRRSLL